MQDSHGIPRSPELMDARDTALLVIDVQEKLVGSILDNRRMVWNIRRLLDAAKAVGLTVVGTEQYPEGLGQTVPELAGRLGTLPSKRVFSSCACADQFEELAEQGVHRLVLCGIETHVCVAQTALDLLSAGFRVYLAVDAVGSRNAIDHDTALRRLETSGATLTTTEAAMFEWCGTSEHPQFKKISGLVKEQPPS